MSFSEDKEIWTKQKAWLEALENYERSAILAMQLERPKDLIIACDSILIQVSSLLKDEDKDDEPDYRPQKGIKSKKFQELQKQVSDASKLLAQSNSINDYRTKAHLQGKAFAIGRELLIKLKQEITDLNVNFRDKENPGRAVTKRHYG